MSEIVKIDAKMLNLVHGYLKGKTTVQLAEEFKLDEIQVSSFLNRKEVRTYIQQQLQQVGYLNPISRIDLLNRMIESKVEEREEAQLPLSGKDLTEIIKLLQKEQELMNRQAQDEEITINVQAEYANLITSLKK
jgi:hypothetical protein